jgi:pyruvate kinase
LHQDLHTFSFVILNPVSEKIHPHIGDDLFLHKSQATGFAEKYPDSGKLPTASHISCTVPEVIDELELGAPVWIDDGEIYAYVSKKMDDFVVFRISKTGPKGAKLTSDKGLNLPGTTLDLSALTKKDKEDLKFICEHADMVGFWFIETADDMSELITELKLHEPSFRRNDCSWRSGSRIG